MNIVLLGSGKVATQIGKALHNAGIPVAQVYSPTLEHAQTLAMQVHAKAISELAELTKNADVYIISVKDDAILGLVDQLDLGDKIVLHTSGSTAMDVLKSASTNYGVLYPLQTFSFDKTVDFSQVPIAVEASSPEIAKQLEALAHKLSPKIIQMTSEQRLVLHIAAVFACNFSNHLYAIAEQLLESKGISFDYLLPLIAETAAKVQQALPSEVQTGPAIRKDEKILQKHLDFLKEQPPLQEIYRLLSQSIVNL
jgi:predicted short-subunit dehydrogenase-like oxidoreductase (DUF2520 family)